MAAKLEKTQTRIYRRHLKDCGGGRTCNCPYRLVRRQQGRQYTETFQSLADAREAQGREGAGS